MTDPALGRKERFLRELKEAVRALRRLEALPNFPAISVEIRKKEIRTRRKFHGFGIVELTLFLLTGNQNILVLEQDESP